MNSIAENAVGGVIASQVNGVIGMIISRLEKEIRLARGFNEELKELQREFTLLRIMVEGACNGKSNELIDYWGNIVKEMGEEANDLLDEWSYEVLRRNSISLSSGCCGMGTRIRYKISRRSMGHKLRNLCNRINSKVYAEANKLHIRPAELCYQDDGASSSQQIQDHETALYYQRQSVDYELVVGRDEDIANLVELLCHPSNSNTDLKVFGIVGMPGLGKTALIKRISMEPHVTNYFKTPIIWLGVSGSFTLIHGLNRMVQQLFENQPYMEDRQALIYRLQEKLKGERYLLILDDVWETSSAWWESLKWTLKEIGGSKDSAIVITSRDKRVVKEHYVHQLEELSEDNSWDLFMKRMPNVDIPANGEKEKIARKMLKKCGGVPLAIRALAGLLIRDQSIGKWREIEESDLWSKKDDEFGILPSLKLSFNYLPSSSLKACFAFCAIFEEDEVIEKHKLICMWMAHGWLQSDNEDEIMEVKGEKYCQVLLNSSLLQEAKMDEYGNVETFKMHDLVWSLARVVSKEDDRSCQVRHVSLPHSKQELTLTSNQKLQTCLCNYYTCNLNFLSQCRYLRVLSIGKIGDKNSKWEMVGSLKHLRYLEFNAPEDIEFWNWKQGPIIKPYHLQTLWMGGFLGFDNHSIPKSCANLFRNGIGDLVNLRHIHFHWDRFGIPEGLGKLTALQTLPPIDFEKNWGGKVSELGLLKNLRGALKLENLKWIKGVEDASSIFLGGKKKLETVRLSFDDKWWPVEERPHQNEVLEAMQPHSNLKNLEIVGYRGTRFPRWLTERGSPLDNLVSLTLRGCRHAVGDLKMENFEYLRFLSISGCNNLSVSFPEHGFRCCKLLEKLELISHTEPRVQLLSYLVDLSPLTKLRCLRIRGGRTGSEIVGLGSLPCLTELEFDQLLPADLDEHSPLCNSLQNLTLFAPLEGDDDTKTFPVQLQHLVSLQSLDMTFHRVETIPEWLGNLTSLSFLTLTGMEDLKHLPSRDAMERLSNLRTLHVMKCHPFLEEDIKNHRGEWFKINHIADVEFI